MRVGGRRRVFGRYVHEGSGLYTVMHPDVPGKRLGTVIRASDGRWYFDGLDGVGLSRGYLTREDACRALRGVTEDRVTS